MPTFAYKARRRGGDILEDVIDAGNRGEAVARLKRQGYFLPTIQPARGGSGSGALSGRALRRISREDISVFTSQLASLLRAGLPLAQGLKGLQAQMKGTPLADVLERIRQEVSESTTLSRAMRAFPQLFGPTYTAAIRAGEESGMLAEVMDRLAGNLKKDIEVRGRIRGALAYPIFLCLLGAATLAVLLTFVIPRFTKLFATMGAQLPLPTRMLLAFSDFMERYWAFVILGGAAGVIVTVLALKRPAVRAVIHRWILKMPWVGTIVRRGEIARFARTLAELLNSGVPILSGLNITRGAMTNQCFAAALEELAVGVEKGKPVADVVAGLPVFTPLVVNMVAVGEQSGQLPELLLEVADIYEKECERAIAAFTTILGPALIVVLGSVLGFVITAILLPVFQASTLAG